MNEIDFLDKYRKDKDFLESYSRLISLLLYNTISDKLRVDPNLFFKLPISFRLKTEESLIQKAFYRNKNYTDPYSQITDKVGGRIVVLLEEQANDVCRVIEELEDYDYSKDRDFENERLKNPELFDYKSHHYILRNKTEKINDGIRIPEGTAVEIQIRTILQHAYSELTHDTIYKPNTVATPEVRRHVAKSMALIEITDQLFSQVNNSLRKSEVKFSQIIEDCKRLIPPQTKSNTDINFCNFILDAYLKSVENYDFQHLKRFAIEYNFVFEKIRERAKGSFLYQQPIILFIYYLVYTNRKIAKAYWPLSKKNLEDIFTDLGYSFERT
ncbi:MAG: hypothetical protein BGN92_09375 [Sphingobacteriales bacterium 41-5]|nr:MAG: hypothetical protein BGN92_09375 [Sphingobacteriales bacterium 41-5]